MSCKDKIAAVTAGVEDNGAAALLCPESHQDQEIEAMTLIRELAEEKAALEAAQQPFQERIAAVKAEQAQAIASLKTQDAALANLITRKIEEYGLDTISGDGLVAEVEALPEIDRDWLRDYHRDHPDSFLSGCVKVTPVVSFIVPGAGNAAEDGKPGELTREQKIARNAAVETARKLVADGFILIDTETTGLTDTDEVISIGAVWPEGGFYSLVRPTVPINPEAQAVHGITAEMVSDAPTFAEILPRLQAVVGSRRLVAYNSRFDAGKLAQSARASGVEPMSGSWTCAMRLYRDFAGLEKNTKLGVAAAAMGIEPEGSLHNAETDARLACRLIERIAQEELLPVDPEPHLVAGLAALPAWDEPVDPASRPAYAARRIPELLTDLAKLRDQIGELSKPYDAQIRAIGKEQKEATGTQQKEYETRLQRAKTLVSVLGKTMDAGGPKMVFSRRYTWDLAAIHRHMLAEPETDFSQRAAEMSYGLRRKVTFKKAK